MTDADRREIERTGDLTAERLRARMLAGEVTRERVALAAWLGYAPALELAEPVDPRVVEEARPIEDWTHVSPRSLGRGAEAALRFGALDKPTLAWLMCEFHARNRLAGEKEPHHLAAVRAWALCPCAFHAEAAERAFPPEPPQGADGLEAAFLARIEPWGAGDVARYVAERRGLFEYGFHASGGSLVERAWQARRMAEVLCWGIS